VADTKISALTAASAAAGANELPINEAGTTKKVTGTQLKTFMNVGTTTNDNAAAGSVSEILETTVLIGAEVSLSTGTAADVATVSLTAGDWDVWGEIATDLGGTTTSTLFQGWINTVSATVPTIPNAGAFVQNATAITTGGNMIYPVGQRRISVASTTTVYLSAKATFATSTFKVYGYIGARRAR